MGSKKHKRLKRRVERLERILEQRDWTSNLPPQNLVYGPPLPGLPDYCTGYLVDEDGDEWNPHSAYL